MVEEHADRTVIRRKIHHHHYSMPIMMADEGNLNGNSASGLVGAKSEGITTISKKKKSKAKGEELEEELTTEAEENDGYFGPPPVSRYLLVHPHHYALL